MAKINQSADTAIDVASVNKNFALPHERVSSMKSYFTRLFNMNRSVEVQHALRNISFEVKKGEFFGIVGRNGSGKSTLLKILAGIYQPTKGEVQVNGKLVPFIELGVGFNPELTGRENIYLNGAMMGFSQKRTESMYDEIVAFAELEEFMDQKLKNYSSGMQVRLAFSIATRSEADILVLDEVLAVGDEAFQRKCYQYFAKLKRDKKTVILVTHNMDSVQQFCDKAIMIEDGSITSSGNPADVAQHYRELFMSEEAVGKKINNATVANKDISIKADFNNDGTYLKFNVTILPKISISDPVVTFIIYNDRGEIVYRWVTDEKALGNISLKKNTALKFKLGIQNIFPNGIFKVNIAVKKRDRTLNYAAFREIITFEIVNPGKYAGDIYWKPTETYEQK